MGSETDEAHGHMAVLTVWASLIVRAEYCRLIMAPHYRAAALGRLWISY